MEQEHIQILKSFDELQFNLGKKTLLDFVKGNPNPTIDKNNLDELNSYGSLYKLEEREIEFLINVLLKDKLLEIEVIRGTFKVLKRTVKGAKEVYEKKKNYDTESISFSKSPYTIDKVTEEDIKLFSHFKDFLIDFTDEQKKAIISKEKHILCVAGAGSGKTTVLTKRIEFLCKFKSIAPSKILGVTFTKKAKEEMQKRLELLGVSGVKIETFNSFCEKILRKYASKIYEREVKVASFGDKISLVRTACKEEAIEFESLINSYFTSKQVREKNTDELFFVFVNDIFSIIDFYKNEELPIEDFYEREPKYSQKELARKMYSIATRVSSLLKSRNLRDFTDQIVDTISFFKKEMELIPKFEYLLVDEFQDVNALQMHFIRLLNAPNLFVVGDPRQAIYGWRGSDIKYVLEFPQNFKDTQVLGLNTNYRSQESIVKFFNNSVSSLGLDDLTSIRKNKEGCGVFLLEQDNEKAEMLFVSEAILNSKVPRNEIFVLARTNRILNKFEDYFSRKGIKFAIKSEEEYSKKEPQEHEITLATVHSIKGMEASEVYLVGANSLSFPNKVQDNPILSLMKEEKTYDKMAEELRLFYVALSRAKDKLVVTYTGNYSKFMTAKMLEGCSFKPKDKSLNLFSHTSSLDSANSVVLKQILREWRSQKAQETGLPLYMVISNAAIDDLTALKPMFREDLGRISGLGPTKIAKYGDELIILISGK